MDGSTLDVITEVLRLLDMSSEQLRQYRDMLVNFERAKFETMLPQPADQALVKDFRQVNEIKESMQKLDSFLGKVSEADHVDPEEG